MQHLPGMGRFYRHYFALYPLGIAHLNLHGYDVVISSSSGYAKGVRTDANAIHVCYCHTPMRWVWRYSDYALREKFGTVERLLLPSLLYQLRRWDEKAARQPDQFVVNSSVVAERVWTAYKRHAVVIPPPIDLERFKISSVQDDFYLVLARLVSYKRIDIAVKACNQLNRRLIIIGDGPDRARLQLLAGPTVEFKGRVSDELVDFHAARCRALLLPGEEDFGLVPLEINAAGRPAIAFKAGGALDTIRAGVSGLFFEHPTSVSLAQAIEEFESRSWDPVTIRKHAEQFGFEAFREKFLTLLHSLNPALFAADISARNSISLSNNQWPRPRLSTLG
jgi:glycosyltransferase involved in cell wall biosynthesis